MIPEQKKNRKLPELVKPTPFRSTEQSSELKFQMLLSATSSRKKQQTEMVRSVILTEEAKRRFDPQQRGCYFEGELTLKYLPQEFYR